MWTKKPTYYFSRKFNAQEFPRLFIFKANKKLTIVYKYSLVWLNINSQYSPTNHFILSLSLSLSLIMDSSSLSSIQTLVKIIKVEIFSKLDNDHDLCSFVSPSAYETAWLAMVPHPHVSTRPLFEGCLEWVLNNQNELGFWGETYFNGDGASTATIDSLPSTLACLVALSKWNVGDQFIEKGKYVYYIYIYI